MCRTGGADTHRADADRGQRGWVGGPGVCRLQRGAGFARGRAAGRDDLLEGEPVRGVLGLGRGRRDVRADPGAFPVAAVPRADRGGGRDGDFQVRVHREALAGVRAAAGPFTDDLGPAQLLQVERELFTAGERGRAGQHVDRLVRAEPLARDVGQRPGLGKAPVVALAQPAELDRLVAVQVTGQERHHGGLAAPALPQVDEQRAGAGQQRHRGGDGLPAQCGREQDWLHVEVADVPGQALRAGHPAAGLGRPPGHGRPLLGVIAGSPPGERLGVVEQPQVLVPGHRLQVGRDRGGQRGRLGRVAPGAEPVG